MRGYGASDSAGICAQIGAKPSGQGCYNHLKPMGSNHLMYPMSYVRCCRLVVYAWHAIAGSVPRADHVLT